MIESGSDKIEMKLRQKSSYSIQHLMAAAKFSRQCGAVQEENKGKLLGAFFDEQISWVSAAIILSLASIESYINELLSDADSLFHDMKPFQASEFVNMIGKLSILQKYDKVLAIKGIEPFNTGESPYQDVSILIFMRNELVYFHPEWHDEQVLHFKLGKKLLYRFELSPFISESEGVLFPQRIISHGCTKWAVEISLAFMVAFSEKIKVENIFENFIDRLSG